MDAKKGVQHGPTIRCWGGKIFEELPDSSRDNILLRIHVNINEYNIRIHAAVVLYHMLY